MLKYLSLIVPIFIIIVLISETDKDHNVTTSLKENTNNNPETKPLDSNETLSLQPSDPVILESKAIDNDPSEVRKQETADNYREHLEPKTILGNTIGSSENISPETKIERAQVDEVHDSSPANYFLMEATSDSIEIQLENARLKDVVSDFESGKKISPEFLRRNFLGTFSGQSSFNNEPFLVTISIKDFDQSSDDFSGEFSFRMDDWNGVPSFGIFDIKFERVSRRHTGDSGDSILINFGKLRDMGEPLSYLALQLFFVKPESRLVGNFYYLRNGVYKWESTVSLEKISDD